MLSFLVRSAVVRAAQEVDEMKKLVKRVLLLAIAAVAVTIWWSTLSDSTKRYVVHIGRQLPDLPFRYFA